MGRSNRSTRRSSGGDINPLLVGLFIICTLITGIICYFVGEAVYNSFTAVMWKPLAIGLYFLIFAVIYFLVYFLLHLLSGSVSARPRGGSSASLKTRRRTSDRRNNQPQNSRSY